MKKYKPRTFQSGMEEITITLAINGDWKDDRVVMVVRDGQLMVKSTHRNDRNVMTVPVQKGKYITFTLTQRELVRMKTLYGDVSQLLSPGTVYRIKSGKREWFHLGHEGDGMAVIRPHQESKETCEETEDLRTHVMKMPSLA